MEITGRHGHYLLINRTEVKQQFSTAVIRIIELHVEHQDEVVSSLKVEVSCKTKVKL